MTLNPDRLTHTCRLLRSGLVILLTCFVVRPVPARDDGSSFKLQMSTWRRELRTILHVPEKLPAIDVKHYGSFQPAQGVIAEKITYDTQYGMRVTAILYRPNRPVHPMPGMLIVPGHGGDKYSWYAVYTGILYAQAGAAVLTYDPIGEGERNDEHRSGSREHDRLIDLPGYPEHLSGLMITDLMQGVSVLRTVSGIDRGHIAVLGYSLGSFVAALAGAIDTRFDALVLSGGGDLDGPGGYWDSSARTMCQAGPWKALSPLGDRAAIVFALNQRRGPTLILNGTVDNVVDIPHHGPGFFADLVNRVNAISGTSHSSITTYFFPGAGHRPSWVTRSAALWLKKILQLPNWTVPQIEAMSVSPIRIWATRTGFPVPRSDLSEIGEGGTPALEDSIPRIDPAQLNVFDRQQWTVEKNSLTFDAWLRHTIASLAKPVVLP